jgi:SAM-dependent methyltransferase
MNPITLAKSLGLDTRAYYQKLSAAALEAAAAEQGLLDLREKLRTILPDIRDQYSLAIDEAEYVRYWEGKLRNLHAFQVRFALDAIAHVGGQDLVLADIGDSCGNHAAYIKALEPRVGRVISVNLDPVAVEKVKAKGGDALLARAEEMDLEGIAPDLFMSFEMVEHLSDPLRFLHRLATVGKSPWLLMSVPYVRQSRFGGRELDMPQDRLPQEITAEEMHLFELSPKDWLRLARFAGFTPVFQRIYRQYPLKHPLIVTQPLWARLDFEGFFAVFLKRDLSLANRYKAW